MRQHAGLYVKNDTGNKNDTFDCFKTQMKIGSTCVFQCPKGFHVTGSKQVDCKKDAKEEKKIGIWFNPHGFVVPNCSGKCFGSFHALGDRGLSLNSPVLCFIPSLPQKSDFFAINDCGIFP